MNNKLVLSTMAALVLVSGCSRNASQPNVTAVNSTNSAAPATNAAAPTGNATNTAAAAPAPVSTGPVDQAFLAGKWGVGGDCSHTMDFNADGTTGDGGTYTISGSTVTVTQGGRAPDPAQVTRTGDDAMTVVGPGAPPMNMTRCR